MATNISHLGQFRCPCVHYWHDGHVSTTMVNGMDIMEAVHGNLSGRSGVFRVDNTGASLVGQEILRERLEEYQT